MPPPRKQSGNVFRIPLSTGSDAFLMIINQPLCAVFSNRVPRSTKITCSDLRDVSFNVCVMDYAFKKKSPWQLEFNCDVPEALLVPACFFKYDELSNRLTKWGFPATEHDDRNALREQPATLDEALKLECVAAWDPEHVEERLVDIDNGVENVWIKQDLDELRENDH